MPSMRVTGILAEVDFDGTTLTINGKNRAARLQLTGESRGVALIPRDQIRHVSFNEASRMVNGKLIVQTVEGRRYEVAFRRGSNEEFRALAEQLGVPGS